MSEIWITYALLGIFVGSSILMFILGWSKKILPFVGFRVGYVYVSKKIWRKYSYLAGGILLALGGLVFILSVLTSPIFAIMVTTIILIILIVILTFLSEREAERESIKFGAEKVERKFAPIPLGIPVIVVAVISFLVVLTYSVYVYPKLPEVIPTHFSWNGTPNQYSSKNVGIAGLLFGIGVVSSINVFLGYLGVKKPEAYYRPYIRWEKMKKFVEVFLILLMFFNVAVAVMCMDVLYYIMRRNFAVPLSIVGISLIVGIGITLAITFYYAITGYRKPEVP